MIDTHIINNKLVALDYYINEINNELLALKPIYHYSKYNTLQSKIDILQKAIYKLSNDFESKSKTIICD